MLVSEVLGKNPKPLRAYILLLYTGRTLEKAREISVKFRKSVHEFLVKFGMFVQVRCEIWHIPP